MIKAIPRRPVDASVPNGYQESDHDYLDNNRELAVALLDKEVARQANAVKVKKYTQYSTRFRGWKSEAEIRNFEKPLTRRTALRLLEKFDGQNDAFIHELVEPLTS